MNNQNARLEEFRNLKAQGWKLAMHDPCTGNWQDHWDLDGRVARVVNSPVGMLFEAGPQYLNEDHHGVLWTKESYSGDMMISFDYTRMDHATKCVNILYIQAQGAEERGYDRDIKLWSNERLTPRMSHYFEKMHTYHVSFAAFENTEEITPGYIRARRYNGGTLTGTDILPDYEPDDFFEYNVPHHMCLIKRDQKIYLYISNGNKEKLCFWDNSDGYPIESGYFGIRHMFTRSAIYKDIRIYTF